MKPILKSLSMMIYQKIFADCFHRTAVKVKGGFKVALYVQVMYDNLKTKLQNDGIARKLSAGF